MSNPIIRIHNTETNEVIDREMTDAEYTAHKKEIEKIVKSQAKAEAEATAKAALLSRLGITAEEARLLLS
jgi:hypothetical protein